MDKTLGKIEMPLPRLAIKVKLPRAYGIRMWAMTQVLHLAGWVGPHDVEVDVEAKAQD